MTHQMKLKPSPFTKIKSKQKTFELRLYDTKRQQVAIGDFIEFSEIAAHQEKILAKVTAIHRFESFAELYSVLPLSKCGYTEETVEMASPEDMKQYYSAEEQAKWGVVAFELEPVE